VEGWCRWSSPLVHSSSWWASPVGYRRCSSLAVHGRRVGSRADLMMAPVISSSGSWILSFWCWALCCHGGTAGGGLVFSARFVGFASLFVFLFWKISPSLRHVFPDQVSAPPWWFL
jgi:hypothetical protein